MLRPQLNNNSIYNDANRYDDIHWWKKDDFDFWDNIVHNLKPKSVLELASGTGRIAYNLIRSEFNYTGLELSPSCAKLARLKLKHLKTQSAIINGDMRDFNLNQTFDLIFIGFNSFLHLLNNKDAQSCLNCVKQHMHSKSQFIIDIFVPNPLFLYRPQGVRVPVLEYRESKTNKIVFVEESNIYDKNTDINKLTWYFSYKNKKNIYIEEFYMRMYFPSTMNQLLIDSGFKILNQWGDYYQTPLNAGSKLQIYNAKI